MTNRWKTRNKTRRFALLSLLVLAGAGAVWRTCGGGGEPGEASAASVTRVVRRDFTSSVLATGAVRPQVGALVRVGARISGKVEHLYANIGDPVKKGQVIAELEKADLEAVVAQRQAELAMAKARLSSIEALRPLEVAKAEAEVRQRRATVDLATRELARQVDLLRRDFTTKQARDRARERLSVAQAQLAASVKARRLADTRATEDPKQARAEVARAEAALRNAEVRLSYATITAPLSGVVASVSTQQGETVAAGFNAPTFVTIIDLKRLQVDAYVDEVDIGKIRAEQSCVFTVDTFPALEFHGKVITVYPEAVLQDNVVNYDVLVEITDSYDGLLRPEMTASVTIALGERAHVLAVPAKAVKRERGRSVVYVRSEAGAQPRAVQLGWKDGGWVEVTAGLRAGEVIFLAKPNQGGES